jgi:hypothetical protein
MALSTELILKFAPAQCFSTTKPELRRRQAANLWLSPLAPRFIQLIRRGLNKLVHFLFKLFGIFVAHPSLTIPLSSHKYVTKFFGASNRRRRL